MTHKCIRTLFVFFFTVILVLMRIRGRSQRRGRGGTVILVLMRIRGRSQRRGRGGGGGGGGREFHTVKVRYIIHLYWLAVQADFCSDVVEC